MKRGSHVLGVVAVIAAAAAALWYVSAPPKGMDGYLERAASTSDTVRSQVQTARIWIETHSGGEATDAAALVGLEEAERDGRAALSQFETHEPPAGALDVRSELVRAAGDATRVLEDIRIAAQLEDWARVDRLAQDLPPLAEALDRLEERTRP